MKCHVCGREFSRYYSLVIHILENHKLTELEIIENKMSKENDQLEYAKELADKMRELHQYIKYVKEYGETKIKLQEMGFTVEIKDGEIERIYKSEVTEI